MSAARLLRLFAIVALTAIFVAEVSAAPRFNSGSRGSRTYSAPPPTATSPNAARPIERSMTSPGNPSAANAARPATPAAQPGGLFSGRNLLGGLAAGFLGAGLIGMLMGNGFMAGLAGFASFLGLLAQIAIVAFLVMLAVRWWKRRSQPATAYANQAAPDTNASEAPRSFLNGFGGLGGGAATSEPIKLKQQDFEAFERTLGEIQQAYSEEDTGTLHQLVTPEMFSYYAEELQANKDRGVVNRLSDVKLLQGDLAEAWREGNEDYATVAMRIQQIDKTFERASGRMVEGSDTPDEGVEYWTFVRNRSGGWKVSAIQQTN